MGENMLTTPLYGYHIDLNPKNIEKDNETSLSSIRRLAQF